jgi:hypothetical protein
MLIISRPSSSAGIIPFTTAAMARYGENVTYEFVCIRGTEYLTVIAKGVKCKEWRALLKRYGLLKRKK